MLIPQNKNVRQLVWHFWYVYTAVEDSEFYCYNKEGDRNSIGSQALCRMDMTELEQRAYSGLWTRWKITLMFYEYEYGFFNYVYVSSFLTNNKHISHNIVHPIR